MKNRDQLDQELSDIVKSSSIDSRQVQYAYFDYWIERTLSIDYYRILGVIGGHRPFLFGH